MKKKGLGIIVCLTCLALGGCMAPTGEQVKEKFIEYLTLSDTDSNNMNINLEDIKNDYNLLNDDEKLVVDEVVEKRHKVIIEEYEIYDRVLTEEDFKKIISELQKIYLHDDIFNIDETLVNIKVNHINLFFEKNLQDNTTNSLKVFEQKLKDAKELKKISEQLPEKTLLNEINDYIKDIEIKIDSYEKDSSIYTKAKELYEKEDFKLSKQQFEKISKNSAFYADSQTMLSKIDEELKYILEIGNKKSIKNSYEFTVLSAKMQEEVYSYSDNMFASYLANQTDEKYFVVKINIKNLTGYPISYSLIDNIKVTFDNKYNYGLQAIDSESSVMSQFWSIDALKSQEVFFVASVPDELANSSFKVTLKIGGELFYIKNDNR